MMSQRLAVITLIIVLTSALIPVPKSRAVWLPDWQFRRQITIYNNSTLNLTDYQVLVNLTDYALTGANADCSDVRFTSSDSYLLPYWTEACEGPNASQMKLFWVRVPYLPSYQNTTIYVYYANPSAPSASNATATFVFFDALDDITSFDWIKEAGDDAVEDSATFGDEVVIKLPDTSTSISTSYAKAVSLPNCSLVFEIEMAGYSGDGYPYIGLKLSDEDGDILLIGSRGGLLSTRRVYIFGTATSYEFGTFTKSKLEKWGLIVNLTNSTVLKAWGGGDVLDRRIAFSGFPSILHIYGVGSSYTGNAWYHMLRIRRWAPQEPAIYIGDEEQIYPLALYFTSPTPNSVFYTANLTVNWTLPLADSALTVRMPNGTNATLNVTGISSYTLQLAEGHNWLMVNGTWRGEGYATGWLDVIIDQYLPNPPIIAQPTDGANLTQDLVNISWSHDGFDTEWYIVKAWRYEPSYWASSITVPAGDSWELVQLAGSGTYYLQVVARDAAGNEAASDTVSVNVSASSVGLVNLTLNRTGFSFTLSNTLNESQDANWNLTISLLTGQQVDFRQGVLSFYPNETKVYNGTWNQNLSDNVYIAEFWVTDSYGKSSGYITSFLAIPPFSEQGVIPLSISQGVWETEPIELDEKIRLTSAILITNANNVESPQQNVNFALPNATISKLIVKNKLTGASYSASANETAGTGTFVAPSIAPYSSVVFQAIAVTEEVNYTLERVKGTEGLKEIGGKMWRKYLANFTNPIPYEVTVYLTENETLKWDCSDCSISGGRIALSLAPEEEKQLVAWVLEPQEDLNVTERPFSAFLNWAISTNLGATANFFGMIIAVAAALAVGGRKYE